MMMRNWAGGARALKDPGTETGIRIGLPWDSDARNSTLPDSKLSYNTTDGSVSSPVSLGFAAAIPR